MKAGNRLKVFRVVDVPLEEVSGICLRRGPAGEQSLVAIGDRVAVAAWFVQPGDDLASLDWHTADVAGLEGTHLPEDDPDVEAVCADGAGRVVLLRETPPRAELIDPLARIVVASIDLEIPGDDDLARAWADPAGSRGEGAVFLPGGHLLVAKEKDPSALIEFGPRRARTGGLVRGGALPRGAPWEVEPGDHRYEALATGGRTRRCARRAPTSATSRSARMATSTCSATSPSRSRGSSDLRRPARRARPPPLARASAGGSATWTASPEGLAFTPNGRAMVASTRARARHNLMPSRRAATAGSAWAVAAVPALVGPAMAGRRQRSPRGRPPSRDTSMPAPVTRVQAVPLVSGEVRRRPISSFAGRASGPSQPPAPLATPAVDAASCSACSASRAIGLRSNTTFRSVPVNAYGALSS